MSTDEVGNHIRTLPNALLLSAKSLGSAGYIYSRFLKTYGEYEVMALHKRLNNWFKKICKRLSLPTLTGAKDKKEQRCYICCYMSSLAKIFAKLKQ